MLKSVFTATAALIAMHTMTTDANAQCADRKRIGGVWKVDDGGTYFFRRVKGDVVWWVGLSPDGGESRTNVFKGVFNEGKGTITGEWSDVRSRNWQKSDEKQGQITLKLQGDIKKGLNGFTKVEGTGWNFGATSWRMECGDTG
jgi:hypothetical protein